VLVGVGVSECVGECVGECVVLIRVRREEIEGGFVGQEGERKFV
jgi:hypothetical protein